MKGKAIKQGLFILLNLSNLLVIGWSLMIYSSLYEWVPWHEGCGMQFIAIFIVSIPAFFVLGIALLILGRFIKISLLNRLLPFIALATFVLPIADGGLRGWCIGTGNILGASLVPVLVVSTVANIVAMNRNPQIGKT